MNKISKFLCSVFGHTFGKGELDITKLNTCERCKHKIRLIEKSVTVPNFGSK